jgi:hypothetical protein
VCLARSEDIGCFAVNHSVTCEKLLFGHAEGNATDVFNEAEYERCPNYVPSDDKESTDDSVFSVSGETCENGDDWRRVGR